MTPDKEEINVQRQSQGQVMEVGKMNILQMELFECMARQVPDRPRVPAESCS